jgi:sarcosine oxidase subunit gamma
MLEAATRRSVALVETSWLAPLPGLSRFVVRGDGAVRAAARQAFGVEIPEQTCRAVRRGFRAALWLGPDEQLLLAPAEEGEALHADIASALVGHAHSFVDVSHRDLAFVVRGQRAEWLLESRCPLPLNLRDFPVGMCTRTAFAKTELVLWRTHEQTFHVEVGRSFTRYFAGMLHEVARCDGVSPAEPVSASPTRRE